MSENTSAMKLSVAYDRLICAILDKRPQVQIDAFLFEYVACDCRYSSLIEGSEDFKKHLNKTMQDAILDAQNYYSHRQGARKVPVPKKSPLGRKLAKGAFAESEEA